MSHRLHKVVLLYDLSTESLTWGVKRVNDLFNLFGSSCWWTGQKSWQQMLQVLIEMKNWMIKFPSNLILIYSSFSSIWLTSYFPLHWSYDIVDSLCICTLPFAAGPDSTVGRESSTGALYPGSTPGHVIPKILKRRVVTFSLGVWPWRGSASRMVRVGPHTCLLARRVNTIKDSVPPLQYHAENTRHDTPYMQSRDTETHPQPAIFSSHPMLSPRLGSNR